MILFMPVRRDREHPLSDTFAGIRPQDIPRFILAELLGAACATTLFQWIAPLKRCDAEAVLLPHDGEPNAVA